MSGRFLALCGVLTGVGFLTTIGYQILRVTSLVGIGNAVEWTLGPDTWFTEWQTSNFTLLGVAALLGFAGAWLSNAICDRRSTPAPWPAPTGRGTDGWQFPPPASVRESQRGALQ